jgi:iron complex transport system substrate-binding protein
MTLRAALLACALAATPAAAQDGPRLVAVGGMVTEVVYALGAEKHLVATDTTSLYPPQALRLPKVGYMRSLSAEGVMALKPRLLIATGDAGPQAAIEQLRAARVGVHILPNEPSVEAARSRIRAIADLLGVPGAGRELEARFLADWERTRAELQRHSRVPRVVFILAHTPANTMVSGEDTAAAAMIRLAGGVNALSGFKGYKPLTAEAVIAAAPEVVLITTEGLHAAGGAAAIWAKPGLALTPAGRTRHLVHLDALYLLGFGPRLPAAVRELAAELHKRDAPS